ncbi:MAG: molybdopterin-dependent oxidoreductase [Crocinitomicaceae bacterium]|nr:molybdopterin-dependent oxidoreductase [Crocinitomicaceae bacterium]
MKKVNISIMVLALPFFFTMCTEKKENAIPVKESKEHSHSNKEVACGIPLSREDSLKYISKTVEVNGDVKNQLLLTVDSLKLMKIHTIENFTVVCQSGANMKEDKTCKGVLLRDILEKAEIIQNNHKDRNFYIVARASDDYKATFSWAEIFNNPTGDEVFVLFEENGEPIQRQGEMILICRNDIKTGPRHVYWLKSIEINRVE